MTKEYDGDILYIILYYVDKKKVRFRKTRTCSIVSFVRLFFQSPQCTWCTWFLCYFSPPLCLLLQGILPLQSTGECRFSCWSCTIYHNYGTCMCTKIARKSLYQLRKSAITNCKKNLMKLNKNLWVKCLFFMLCSLWVHSSQLFLLAA